MEDIKTMRYETQIQLVPSSMKQLNKQFALVDILLCYHGENRNRTSMSKEVIESALPSLYGVPIVGEYIYLDDGSKDFGSHGGKIILSDKGIKFEDTTKPYGFITKDAVDNAKWVTITEKDGFTQHEYLELKGCIVWEKRYEEVSSLLDKNYGQSMEISINDGYEDKNGYYVIEDMTFSAACILGSNPDGTDVIPCFESACIGRHYELDSFKQEFSLMLDEYKKLNESATAVHDKETNNKPNNKEEKKFMELKKFSEILSTAKIGESDVNKYRLLNVTDSKVFALDMEDYKPYGFDYAVTTEGDAENIVIDFESKVEMSLSATDKITEENFEEFSIGSEIESVKESIFANEVPAKIDECTKILKAEYEKDIDEMGASFKELNEKYDNAVKELEKYKKKEEFEKAEQHKAEVNALFEKYANKLGKCAEFLVYKAKCNPDEVTLDEVSEKLTLMVGKYMMESGAKKNFSYNPTETGVAGRKNGTIENKYGHLLDKYIK